MGFESLYGQPIAEPDHETRKRMTVICEDAVIRFIDVDGRELIHHTLTDEWFLLPDPNED